MSLPLKKHPEILIHTHMAILPSEPGLAVSPLRFAFPYILLNTISPCPSPTGEGTAMKEEEWKESTFCEW